MPLVSRLTEGIDKLKELAGRQRKEITSLATSKSFAGGRFPEVRFTKIDNAGRVSLKFTSELDFPEGVAESIKEQLSSSSRRLESEQTSNLESLGLIEIAAVYAAEVEDDEAPSKPILANWQLVELTSTAVELRLDFEDSLQVSSGQEPALLFI